MRMWQCTKCNRNLLLDSNNFNKDKRINRGFRSSCKLCDRKCQEKYRKTEAYRLAHNKAKRNYNRGNKDYIHKQKVRTLTREKYGKLPFGLEYHHTTIPYHVDRFKIVESDKHRIIHGGDSD